MNSSVLATRAYWWLAVSIYLLAASSLSAQEARGTIGGRVLDSSGAVIPGASVSAVNISTNVSIATRTNEEGNYALPYLLPGVYRLSAAATGFKSVRRDNIELRVRDTLQVDLTLEVGAATEVVQVSADAPLLQTAEANIGQVIDARRIADLPIPHGSPFTLIYLAAGVTSITNFQNRQMPGSLNDGTTQMNFNGAPRGTTDFTMDGIPDTQTSQASNGMGMASSPPADLVQEFRVETAFDASVGHTSGTLVNVALKSGTNQPHATAYGYARRPGWNANTFFANRSGQGRSGFEYTRYGATLLGPAYIPKIYDGRNRTFFSYGYEYFELSSAKSYTGTVPEPQQLTGDFSGLLAIGSQYQIYDPATTQPAANGRMSRQPFAGNVIPRSRISPISTKIAAEFPKPNNPLAGRDGVNNYTTQTRVEPNSYYNHLARVDHNISDKQRFYARVSAGLRVDGPYRDWWDGPSQANKYTGTMRQVALDDVYTFSPSLVMNVRYGYSRYAGGHFPRRVGFDVSTLGFNSQVTSLLSAAKPMFPQVEIAGIKSLGDQAPDVLNNDVHSFYGSFMKQLQSHNLKFGADLRAYRDNVAYLGYSGGRFVFGNSYTNGPLDNSTGSPGGIGQGTAAFLLGLPTGGSLDRNASQAIQSTYWSFFVHDNWRVSRKLTVDLGIRWEYEGPVTERFNRAVRGFDPSAPQRIEAAARAAYALRPDAALPASQFKVRGGLLFAGVGGAPRIFWDRSLMNFAPRIGVAYQAAPKVVLRTGFGVYPIQIGQPAQNRAIQTGFSQSTSLVPTLDRGETFIADLANPFPSGALSPAGAALGPETYLGLGLSFYNPVARTPYSMRWDFNTQAILPGATLLEVGYGGSKSLKLQTNHAQNALPNSYLSTSPVRDQATIDYLGAAVANPFAGLLPGTGLNGATISRGGLLVAYPQFGGITMKDYQGYSWYHAARMRVERRFQKGFTLLASYTFSKTMDAMDYLNAADPVPYKSISFIDRPHHLSFSGIFELPVGRGKPLLANTNRVVNALVGNWQVGSIWHFQSGRAIQFGNVLFSGNFTDIALPKSERSIDRWFNIDAGFERSSARQPASNLRTFPGALAGLRQDTYNAWDLSVLKNTKIYERYELQFRAEFFNAFNHPTQFGIPNTTPTSSAFGKVTDMWTDPRNVQLGLKLVF